MEVALEMDDDLFFADLTKQITLLIMDDDEDPLSVTPPLSLQGYSRRIYSHAGAPLMHRQQAWRREGQGTGVFIPRSLQPKRKNRNGKSNSNHSKINRQQSDRAQKNSPTYSLQPMKS